MPEPASRDPEYPLRQLQFVPSCADTNKRPFDLYARLDHYG